MSWIRTKHIWSRWVTPHWVHGGGCAPPRTYYSSLFWYCCMWQTLRPQTQLTPPWTWATRPQTFHIKVNFRTCTDDQAARERGFGSADPWDEDYCRTRRNGIANKERQSVNVGDFCLQTLSRRCCAWTWQSLLWAKVWGQFFCNRYTDRTFSTAHVCSNDHLWWAVTAVSLWCWALIGCICCRGVETFWFGQTVTQWALNWPWTKHEGKHITWSAHAWAFLIHYRDVPIWNTIKIYHKMSLNLH